MFSSFKIRQRRLPFFIGTLVPQMTGNCDYFYQYSYLSTKNIQLMMDFGIKIMDKCINEFIVARNVIITIESKNYLTSLLFFNFKLN